MTFSEAVAPEFSHFAVIDRARRHYEAAGPPTIGGDGGQVSVALQPGLAAGTYIVQWTVVSAVDGHLTQGNFAFIVRGPAGTPPGLAGGAAPAGTPAPGDDAGTSGGSGAGDSPATSAADLIVRWLSALLPALLVGLALFRLWVVPTGLARLAGGAAAFRARLDVRFLVLALASAWLLLVTLGAELLLQATRVTESDLGTVLASKMVLGAVLAGVVGRSLEWRALAVLVIFAALVVELAVGRLGRVAWGLVALAGAGYYLAQTSSAHAASLGQALGPGVLQRLAPAVNMVHLLATAGWVGGLCAFVAVLLPAGRALPPAERASLVGAAIGRFSRLALVLVPLVALSGLLLYLAEDPTVGTTLASDYGRAVLAKATLLGLLLVPAAYNLRRVGPGLARRRATAGPAATALMRAFQRAVRVEVLLVTLALGFAALLTLSAPPGDPAALARARPAVTPVPSATPRRPAVPTTLTLRQTVRGVALGLTLTHGAVDDLAVTLRDAQGPIPPCPAKPAADARCVLSVKLTLTDLDDNSANAQTAAPAAAPGTYALPEGPFLPLDGDWQIAVVARRWNQPDDLQAAFRYQVHGATLTGHVSTYVNVDVSYSPDPPVAGPEAFTFHLTDGDGRPITDASVMIQGTMPAYGHFSQAVQLQNQAGTYTGSLLLPMSGGWAINLSIVRPGQDTLAAQVALDLAAPPGDLTPVPAP